LPVWLNEGLAEYFSTVRITNQGCTSGGILARRLETLKHDRKWLALPQLLALTESSPLLQTREGAAIFYAESWSLTDLLIGSPEYAPHFRDLIAKLNSGTSGAQALTAVYGKSLEAIAKDQQIHVDDRSFTVRSSPAIPHARIPIETSELSDIQSRALLADLLMADSELDRAQSIYAALEQQSPRDPKVLTALGVIADREHNRAAALKYWRKAIDKGSIDADLCYRYALLAEEAGQPVEEIRHGLERAIELKPDFDDARYKLALLESNAGDFAAAVTQLRAIHAVSPVRAFSYWSALSYASMELGDRVTAKNAAQEALKRAGSAPDRLRADQLAYMADTDLAVRFVRDGDGHSRLAEIRVPHGTADWNPFIEPTDRIKKTGGQLREVFCASGKLTGLLLDTSKGRLTLAIPDPQRVFMHSGPAEFTCGSQPPKHIEVEYAAAYADAKSEGIIRGITFP
jgi:Flp pilus assembly protein TadD